MNGLDRQSQFASEDADEPASKAEEGICKQDAFHFVTYALNLGKTMIIYFVGGEKNGKVLYQSTGILRLLHPTL
jgi:hypothetical protein